MKGEAMNGQTSDLDLQVVQMTPEMAERLLGKVAPNRHQSGAKIGEYAADMKAGRWGLNGASIVVDPSGSLIDGQHRLRAVVVSGAVVPMIVVRGVSVDAGETIDTGRRRTIGDVLGIRGEKSATALGSTIALFWRWEGGIASRLGGSLHFPTHRQALDVLTVHPGLRESVLVGEKVRKAIGARASVMAACHYRFATIDQTDGEAFFDGLVTGTDLPSVSSIFLLRELVIKDRRQQRGRRSMSTVMEHALTIKAWNAWREGREVRLLKWTTGGASPEAFPEPV